MPSFVDAADAAGAAQGSSALVVATGAAVAAGHDDFSVVVAAASSPSLRQSDSGQCRKRLTRTDFPDISDTEYREMMQRRRKEQETTRDRGRGPYCALIPSSTRRAAAAESRVPCCF